MSASHAPGFPKFLDAIQAVDRVIRAFRASGLAQGGSE